jgi:hypothetical protein
MVYKMKNFLPIYFLIAFGLCITGCDEVDDPVIEFAEYRDDLYGDPASFTPVDAPHRKVLLEDFTGHDCGNCPNGHVRAAELLAQYGEDLAVVAVHAGSLAAPFPPNFPDDWVIPEGEYYLLTQVGQDVMPKGRTNRIASASVIHSPSAWPSKVAEAFDIAPEVNLQMNVSYVPNSQHLNIHVFSQWFENLTGDYRLVIMIAENEIIAPQLWYNNDPEYIPDYLHEHMLRATVTGATGLVVATNPQSGTSHTDSYTFDWNSTWVPEHCEVIAFITEGEDGRVLNVQKIKVIP